MAENSSIQWTDATWNPITGCTLVDQGCKNCYAAELATTRLKHHPSRKGLARKNSAGVAAFTGEVRFNEQWLDQPLHWRKPRMIFVCAHGDLFHPDVPEDWIDKVFAVMALAPHHTFQVLTKRPERAAEFINDKSYRRIMESVCDRTVEEQLPVQLISHPDMTPPNLKVPKIKLWKWPLPNVWLGTSVSDQPSADERIPHLLSTPAAMRFVSYEPALGPVDFTNLPPFLAESDRLGIRIDALKPGAKYSLDWIICGGESGRNARPMHPDWARSARDQCQAAGTAFFFKQWGAWTDGANAGPNSRTIPAANWWDNDWDYFDTPPSRHDDHIDDEPEMFRVGTKAAGRLLDGHEWNEVPT